MNHILRRIDPWSAAKVVAVSAAILVAAYVVVALALVAILGVEFGEPGTAFAMAAPWMLLLLPFGYLIGVYLMTLIICALFNAAAGWLGGIRIELTAE